jgi:hypothetical protein
MPDLLLVWLPCVDQVLFQARDWSDWKGRAAAELVERGHRCELGALSRWCLRVRFLAGSQRGETTARVHDIREIAPMCWVATWCGCAYGWDGTFEPSDAWTLDVADLVSSWVDSRGMSARVAGLQGTVFVSADEGTHREVGRILSLLHDPETDRLDEGGGQALVVYRLGDLSFVPLRDFDAEARREIEKRHGYRAEVAAELLEIVQSTVGTDLWVDYGGDVAEGWWYRDMLLVSTTAEHHAQIERFMDQLRVFASGRGQKLTIRSGLERPPSPGSDRAHDD